MYLREPEAIVAKHPACLALILLADREVAKAADSLPQSSYSGRPANPKDLGLVSGMA
jgi:hypothetical protein